MGILLKGIHCLTELYTRFVIVMDLSELPGHHKALSLLEDPYQIEAPINTHQVCSNCP